MDQALCSRTIATLPSSTFSSIASTSSITIASPSLHRPSPRWRSRLQVCASSESEDAETMAVVVNRRQACLDVVAVLASAAGVLSAKPGVAVAKEVEVGAYLPVAAEDPNFVQFKASSKDTPALRAGNVMPYQFILPRTWKQERVANILSGNYCQPKCAEPWVEVKFADDKQGSLQVVAAPMVRLTNKPNATIEEIGDPERILSALGQFVTGNSYDPEEVTETSVSRKGDLTYYNYQLETPFAKTGQHNLATATAKGNVVMLFVVSASDKQWSNSEGTLRAILNSFGV
ncbi:hypothetical protein R1flu_028012 [Riccia fluitans]|uniref:PsbP C-terminal domain-containing protein n=1 Tax=Riccia fluitans TaxID=41844 RepID=A0ABD1XKG4_9MARC